MFGYYNPGEFVAKTNNNKTVFKPKKIDGLFTMISQQIVALNQSISSFNEHFNTLNSKMCSDQWSNEAATIAKITEDIAARSKDIATNLIKDVNEKTQQVTATNKKMSQAMNNCSRDMDGSLQRLQGLGK